MSLEMVLSISRAGSAPDFLRFRLWFDDTPTLLSSTVKNNHPVSISHVPFSVSSLSPSFSSSSLSEAPFSETVTGRYTKVSISVSSPHTGRGTYIVLFEEDLCDRVCPCAGG